MTVIYLSDLALFVNLFPLPMVVRFVISKKYQVVQLINLKFVRYNLKMFSIDPCLAQVGGWRTFDMEVQVLNTFQS